ncbi:hypothetical protein ACFYKX_11095 [Cytobacillus sp. FJAT-54145]|uniref:YozE SAM-like domain-containing protein n=1 Tax=Cytobacillus spartinae TaxID=3299023 RepID=A0ABW6KAA3_9BACI
MSFVEWYKHTYGDEWHEDYALLGCSHEWLDAYQTYCDQHHLEPIWNG